MHSRDARDFYGPKESQLILHRSQLMIHVGISVLDDRFIIFRREKKDRFDKDYTSYLTQTPEVEMKVEQIVAFGKQRTSQKQRNTVDLKKKRLLDKFPFSFYFGRILPSSSHSREKKRRKKRVCSCSYQCLFPWVYM